MIYKGWEAAVPVTDVESNNPNAGHSKHRNMDIQKSETLQLPGTPPDGQYSTVEVEVGGEQSVEPSVARKQNRKKRAASGEPEREEGDPTPVTKDKSRTKKRNLELGRGTKSENESLVKLDGK